VIRHLPINTPAEDICDGLVRLGFDVVKVKQMTTTRRSSPEEPRLSNLPLFLVTLPRTAKSQQIFQLPSLCHIAIKVEAYRSQNALTQCHNCQQFGHVWAKCKQPPRCLWYGGGYLQKDCPESVNAASTPACCNCQLAEGGKPHPPNYQGCRRAREELQGGYSPQTLPRQVSPLRRRSEALQPNNTHRHNRFLEKPPPFRSKTRYPEPWRSTKYWLVNQGSNCKQPTSRQHVEGGNCSTADYDRVQWCSVRRRQNSGHH
jgi:hypothetical protein